VGRSNIVTSFMRKSEGAISLAGSRPLLSDFAKTRFGFRVAADCHFQNRQSPASGARASRSSPVCSIRCKSFLVPSRCSQFPECLVSLAWRFPCGSRCRFSRTFLSLFPCGRRFWFSWSSFRGFLAGAASGSPMTFSALFYWRIAPPLIRKLLSNSVE
jgi:hypothetical protein